MLRLPAVCALGLLWAGAATAQVNLFTDPFDSPDYRLFQFNNADGDPAAVPEDQSFVSLGNNPGTGGNPDTYLEVLHNHELDRSDFPPDSSTSIQSYIIDQSFTYTPSDSGAIQSITFSLDYRGTEPFNGIFFAVEDGTGGGSNTIPLDELILDGAWRTYTSTVLTNADFSGRDFAGSSPLKFGFGFTSFFDAADEDVTFLIDVDNFKVNAVIPEPTSAALLALSAVSLLRRRSAKPQAA